MRDKKLAIPILIVLISMLFDSITLAGKPTTQTYHTEYGYAMLDNSEGYKIWNDNANPYVDINKSYNNLVGQDLVELEIYDSSKALKSIHVYLGKPELPQRSSRRVEFLFPIQEITQADTYYANYLNNKAVYDILKSEQNDFTNRIIHADIVAYPGSKLRVQFVVDPGCTAEPDAVPTAITQSAVDAFYSNDTNVSYWTAKLAEPSPEADAHDHIIYTLYYDLPFSVTGTYPEFVIETAGSATLAVGKLKSKKSASHEIVYLAECDVPFKLIVTSLGKLSAAPRRQDKISTAWGDAKTALIR
jgi:hypothetical protein